MDEKTAVAVKEDLYSPQVFSVDDINLEDAEKAKETKEPESDELEVEVEGKEAEIKTETLETEKLQKEIAELKGEILKISTKKETKLEPKKADAPEKLTRSQIVGILKEHKDDPEVLLNVIEHMAEQKAEATRDTTLKDVNYRQWHSNLSGISNRILSDDEDGYLAANPKVKAGLDEYAENLGFKDHPVGKLAAYAIMRLSEMAKVKSKGDDKSAEGDKGKDKGKMDKTRAFDRLDKNLGLTPEHIAAAKKFGVKLETYAKFVRRA